MSKATLFLSLSAVSVVFCAAASASTVELIIDPQFGTTEGTGSTARVLLEFTTIELEDLMTVTIENTTPPEIGAWITAVGLELPDIFGDHTQMTLALASDYFDTLLFDESMAPPWLDAPGGYDLVISGDPSFLGNSPQGAPLAGESQTVVINLGNTDFTPDELASLSLTFYDDPLANFLVGRFQTVGLNGEDSDKVRGTVPEPTTLLLLGIGLCAATRRKWLLRS